MKKKNKKRKNRPVDRINFGAIKVAIWASKTKYGKKHFANVQKVYKDGDDFESTSFFGREDLLPAAKALNEAHSRVLELDQEEFDDDNDDDDYDE